MRIFAAAIIVIGLFGISGLANAIGLHVLMDEASANAWVEEERVSELASVSTDATLSGFPGTTIAATAPQLTGTGQWMDLVLLAAEESGAPWQVLIAIMGIESGGNPQVVSPVGALGLMQVMPQYWQETANRWGPDLMDPWVNIRTAAEILTQGYLRWGTWEQAAAAYFGAIDSEGNVTIAVDAFNTSGYEYVTRFKNNLVALGFIEFLISADILGPETENMLEFAMSALGTPYVWGGASDTAGFDCSGLVVWAYSQVGVAMPRTAADQFNATARIEQAELLQGDLVFFQNTAGPGITHVGIYVGGGYMLNAPAENDVVQLMALNTPYWAEHLAGYGRVAVPPAV
ncbi:hypothetical protein BH24CHL1_BH24CHL1_10560 [soil metagenome]